MEGLCALGGNRGKCMHLYTHTPLPQTVLPRRTSQHRLAGPQLHKAQFAAPCLALF
jgi:hypothetical protein